MIDDLGREGMPLERACAAAVRLLDLGYFRIGNDVYADENGSFGLTTLERRHVKRHQDALVFAFVGKSGVEHDIEIDDEVVVDAIEVMRRRRSDGDPSLLAYKNGRGWRSLLPELVNDYVRGSTGLDADRQGLPHLARHRARPRPRWPRLRSPGRPRRRGSAR